MGLFSRKPKTDGPDPVQTELAAMQARLDAAERAKTELESELGALGEANSALAAKISTLDQANAQLDSRLGALDHGFTMMGDELNTITATNTQLDQRLSAIDELDAQVRELSERLDTPLASTPTPATPPPAVPAAPSTSPPPPLAGTTPPPPPTSADDGRIDDMAAQLEDLAAAVALHTEQMATARARMEDIDELSALLAATASDHDGDDERKDDDESIQRDVATLHSQLTDVSSQMSAMDGRVTAVSTELANQLTELSRDIDELNRRAAEAEAAATERGVDIVTTTELDTGELEARLADRLDEAIDDVLDTTEKLAAEQARYEIQFRADLAELAERLRRPGAA